MAIHDDYARTTPVELAFPDAGRAREVFDAVAAEAEARNADPSDLAAFMQIGPVGACLRDLRAPDVGGEALHQYAVLLQQAYLFDRAGRPLYLLDTGVVRYLVDGAPGGATVALPAEAGYLQLPQHLVWLDGGAGHPESVDGMFWNRSADGVLRLLLAQGLRGDRPGLAVVPVAEAPWSDAGSWLDVQVRGEGADFATTLPGGELEGLYSFQAAGEPLKLFARTCAYLLAFPDMVEAADPVETPPADGPTPSRFSYRRIGLDR
ncbi:MAG: hypothetical protein RJQ04_02705 [Longimicrobiales bacterium]